MTCTLTTAERRPCSRAPSGASDVDTPNREPSLPCRNPEPAAGSGPVEEASGARVQLAPGPTGRRSVGRVLTECSYLSSAPAVGRTRSPHVRVMASAAVRWRQFVAGSPYGPSGNACRGTVSARNPWRDSGRSGAQSRGPRAEGGFDMPRGLSMYPVGVGLARWLFHVEHPSAVFGA